MSELSAYGAHHFYYLSRTYRARPYVFITVNLIVYRQSLVSPVHRFPVSSANAARHLRGQQVGRQTLMVHTISPTPGIRQVSAPSCATSSPHCPRTLHGFLHSNGGGTISSTSSSPAFQPIFCMSIPTAKAHSCGTPVSTGKADIYDKSHFSGFTVLPILPVILSVPICPLL